MKPQKTSNAKPRKTILKKYKKLMGEHLSTSNFKQPAAILLRRTGRGEWMEDVTQGILKYKHTNGEERYIMITPENRFTLDYGKKQITMYLLHEDFPTPLPENPMVTTEVFQIATDKTLQATKDWKVKQLKAKTGMIKEIGTLIAIIIGAIVLAEIMLPNGIMGIIQKPETIKTVTQVVNNTVTRLP